MNLEPRPRGTAGVVNLTLGLVNAVLAVASIRQRPLTNVGIAPLALDFKLDLSAAHRQWGRERRATSEHPSGRPRECGERMKGKQGDGRS